MLGEALEVQRSMEGGETGWQAWIVRGVNNSEVE